MASRLQFQNIGTGYILPSHRAESEQKAQSGFEVPTILLAAHQIEPELLGSRPRFIRCGDSSLVSFFWIVQIGVTSLHAIRLFHAHPDYLWISVCMVVGVISIPFLLHYVTHKMNARKHELLRSGIPHRAIVEEISDTSNLITESCKLAYWYQNGSGQPTRTTINVPRNRLSGRVISPGDTFTLLISATDPEEVLPYFLTKPFEIIPIEATSVSRKVSLRVARKAMWNTLQSVSRLSAIEPELLGATPRPVRMDQENIRVGIGMGFVISSLCTAIGLFWTAIRHDPALAMGVAAGTHLVYVYFAAYWKSAFKTRTILQTHLPATAVVEKMLVTTGTEYYSAESQILMISYKYVSETGEAHSGKFVTKRSRAWQLGICEGASFTVLYKGGNPSEHTPYFRITESEIVGAMGARITQP
ncbi:MAG: hypothetical protein H8F28_21275 [Fibrella sp.]|nr:hypothetical protein [Armatimonadota bacterium]